MTIPVHDTCAGMRYLPLHGLYFDRKKCGGWAIRSGISKFLVAEGSAWSMPVGRRMFAVMLDDARRVRKP